MNPRLAVLVHASTQTTTKLLAGKAFRAPSVFELFYQSDTWRLPDSLKPGRYQVAVAVVRPGTAEPAVRLAIAGRAEDR